MTKKSQPQSITDAWQTSVQNGININQRNAAQNQPLNDAIDRSRENTLNHIAETDTGFYRPDTNYYFHLKDGGSLKRQRLDEQIDPSLIPIALRIKNNNPHLSREQALSMAKDGAGPNTYVDKQGKDIKLAYDPIFTGGVQDVGDKQHNLDVDRQAHDFLRGGKPSGRVTPILEPEEAEAFRQVGGQPAVDAGGRVGFDPKFEPKSEILPPRKTRAEIAAQVKKEQDAQYDQIKGYYDKKDEALSPDFGDFLKKFGKSYEDPNKPAPGPYAGTYDYEDEQGNIQTRDPLKQFPMPDHMMTDEEREDEAFKKEVEASQERARKHRGAEREFGTLTADELDFEQRAMGMGKYANRPRKGGRPVTPGLPLNTISNMTAPLRMGTSPVPVPRRAMGMGNEKVRPQAITMPEWKRLADAGDPEALAHIAAIGDASLDLVVPKKKALPEPEFDAQGEARTGIDLSKIPPDARAAYSKLLQASELSAEREEQKDRPTGLTAKELKRLADAGDPEAVAARNEYSKLTQAAEDQKTRQRIYNQDIADVNAALDRRVREIGDEEEAGEARTGIDLSKIPADARAEYAKLLRTTAKEYQSQREKELMGEAVRLNSVTNLLREYVNTVDILNEKEEEEETQPETQTPDNQPHDQHVKDKQAYDAEKEKNAAEKEKKRQEQRAKALEAQRERDLARYARHKENYPIAAEYRTGKYRGVGDSRGRTRFQKARKSHRLKDFDMVQNLRSKYGDDVLDSKEKSDTSEKPNTERIGAGTLTPGASKVLGGLRSQVGGEGVFVDDSIFDPLDMRYSDLMFPMTYQYRVMYDLLKNQFGNNQSKSQQQGTPGSNRAGAAFERGANAAMSTRTPDHSPKVEPGQMVPDEEEN
jgi:hypothetical protein